MPHNTTRGRHYPAARLRITLVLSLLLHLPLLATWSRDDRPTNRLVPAGAMEVAVEFIDTRHAAVRPSPRAPLSHASAIPKPPATFLATAPAPAAGEVVPVSAEAGLAGTAARHRLVHQYLAAQLAHYFTYPALARRQGWEGQVLLALTIEADGQLDNLQVASSSGYAVLDAAALHALQRVGRLAAAADWLAGSTLDMRLPVIYRLRE